MSYNYNDVNGARNRIIGPSSKLWAEADIFTPTVDQKCTLGRELDLNDGTGRKFRYCQNSTAAILAKALMNSSAALDAQGLTATAQTAYGVAAGEVTFNVLLTSGHGWATDALINGWMLVTGTAGGTAMGDMYLIKDNQTNGATEMRVTICDRGGVRNVIAALDDVVLFQNKCANTVVSATDPISGMVGVSLADVPISYFYWAQFRGYAPILTDDTDTVVVGDIVTLSDSVAGTVHLNDFQADDVPVGNCVFAGATDECSIVDLLIP